MFKKVAVRFQFTRGLSKVAFASALSRQMNVRLLVAVPGCLAGEERDCLLRILECLGDQTPPSLIAAGREGRLEVIEDLWPLADPSAINVGPCTEANRFPSANYLVPYDESALAASGTVPEILMPFGNSLGAVAPALPALGLAVAINAKVCLYHTTWREPDKGQAPPAEHMCERARKVQEILEAECREAEVPFETVIECASDVAQGWYRKALERGSHLVAVARGQLAIRGSYVDQMVERSTVPVLVMGRQQEVRQ